MSTLQLGRALRGLAVLALVAVLHAISTTSTQAQSQALLLFDGQTGKEFAGCLNCSQYSPEAVCNQYGTYGSAYQSNSIWNQYGRFGSRYQINSPWNAYGEGLRIVDSSGAYYGRLTIGYRDRSRLPLVQAIVETYDKLDGDTRALRNLLCN